MITIQRMTKSYSMRGQHLTVFSDVSIEIPTDRPVAILGAEASGKSALIRMLSGLEGPTLGAIDRYAAVSFPVGSVHALRPHLSGRQNAQHVARLYGSDPDEVAAFVAGVTEMGGHFDEPIRRLPTGLRGALAWAIAYAIPFDTYLIDESIGFGSTQFRTRCEEMLQARAEHAGFILATGRVQKAWQLCDCAVVIAERKLHWFDDMLAAEAAFQAELERISSLPHPAARREATDDLAV
jgi:capsular polysaccharide transport system ATP-binding protein